MQAKQESERPQERARLDEMRRAGMETPSSD